jgi:hypothetical protein
LTIVATMSAATRRALRAMGALVSLAVATAVAGWGVLLPGPRWCGSLSCGSAFDPGGLNVFGEQHFTLAQTAVIAAGVVVGVFLLARAVLPAWLAWTSVGLGTAVLALSVVVSLPEFETGPAPSVPCSTPGPDGPIAGRCSTGSAPVDPRVADRAASLAVGPGSVAGGLVLDRRRLRAS